jgi:hypothetical protein
MLASSSVFFFSFMPKPTPKKSTAPGCPPGRFSEASAVGTLGFLEVQRE